MSLSRKKILNLNYTSDPDYLIGIGCATYYKDIFIRVLIKDFNFFDRFGSNKFTKEEITKTFKIKDRALCVILPLFINQGLLDLENDYYFLTKYSVDLLLSKSSMYLGNFVLHGSGLYNLEMQLFQNVKSILKKDKPLLVTKDGDWIDCLKNNKNYAKIFTKGLDERGLYLAKAISKKINISKSKNLIDIGGNSGIYSCVLSTYFKNLKIDILDIPNVVSQTKKLLLERGFGKQINVISGDMFNYNYNQKYDVHFYSNVLHDWDIKDVNKLLKISYDGLPVDGKIIIHDGHKNLKNNPISLLENDISLLMATRGRYYYYFEMKDMLLKVGFKNIKKINTVSGRSIIIADK